MTRFEWFEQGHAQLALEVGIISPSDFTGFIQYKRFCDLRPDCETQSEAITILSEEFKTSESSIYRAVSLFRNGKQ